MTDLQNRTLICSVLFLDIVEYSRKPVAEQIAVKDRLNALLSDALRGVAVNDRIILDTGDGAAISFIGDPEDALFVATVLRDAIEADGDPALSARMGINLGPVRLVKDINGRPNVIGDGINVAQRIMTFAEPGKVLVSRSYYEVVSRLSEEGSNLFSYEGARTDKHIREHEVYALGAVQAAAPRRVEQEPDWRKDVRAGERVALARGGWTPGGLVRLIVRRPPLATAIAVGTILIVALVVRGTRENAQPPASIAAAPIVVPQASAEPTPLPQRLEPEYRAEAPPPAPVAPTGSSDGETLAVLDDAPAESAAPSARDVAVGRGAGGAPRTVVFGSKSGAIVSPATLSFAVAPWGEIHVNGKVQGVSPPLKELHLAPGKHRIEVRNTGAQAHVVNVDAKPGERIRIKHKFK